jgi:hypothetical protein
MLTDLINFPLSCIYGFTDDNNGVYLQFSNNALYSLSENVTDLKRGIHDCRLLQDAYNRGVVQLKVFKSWDAPIEGIVARAFCSFIINSGYVDLSNIYTNTRYSIRTQVRASCVHGRSHPLVYILVQSHSQGAIVAGICDNMVAANNWIREHHVNPDSISDLVFMDNEHTKTYHEQIGRKLVTKVLVPKEEHYKPRPLRDDFVPPVEELV